MISIEQLSAYNAHLNYHAMNNHPPLAATNNLLATVSSKTHYYQLDAKAIHISVEDLFGKADYGGIWFNNAFDRLDPVAIRVKNKDTGNSAEFSMTGPYVQQNRMGGHYRLIHYGFTGNYTLAKGGHYLHQLDVRLVVWEKEQQLQEWIAYMTEKEGVRSN